MSNDLSTNNLLPILLDERESIKALIDNASRRLLEINNEVKAIMGEVETAVLPGWKIVYRAYLRREYTMPETNLRPLVVKRIAEEE